jgi:hypothetical protein
VAGSDRTRLHGIAVNDYQSCGLSDAGEAYCWGLAYGETMRRVHDGYRFASLVARHDRVELSSLDGDGSEFSRKPVTSLFGYLYLGMCGITFDGRALCWQDAAAAPTPIPGALRVRAIAPAFTHSCALTASDGAVYCWGVTAYVGAGSLSPPGSPPWRVVEPPDGQ